MGAFGQYAVERCNNLRSFPNCGGDALDSAGPDVADLMRAARSFLTQILTSQAELLDELREHPVGADPRLARLSV